MLTSIFNQNSIFKLYIAIKTNIQLFSVGVYDDFYSLLKIKIL